MEEEQLSSLVDYDSLIHILIREGIYSEEDLSNLLVCRVNYI
jgi:hypothetical protein